MSEGMSEKLKACPNPWCDQTHRWAHQTMLRPEWAVCCACGFMGPLCRTEADAIAAWNTRPAESALSVSREALCRLIEEHCPELDFVTAIPLGSAVEKLADAILAITTPESANVGEVGHLRAFVARIADTKRSNPGGVSDSQYNAKIVREWRRDARNLIDILQTGAK